MLRRPRLTPLALCGLAAALFACAPSAEPASSSDADAAEVEDAAPADAPAPAATAPSTAEAPADAPPAGYYECYFHGTYGLQNSSLISLDVLSATEYEALEERGRYVADGGAVRMESGPLAGRVAHLEESDGRPAIVFRRDENEVDDRPTIDVSDTWCYHEPR